MRRYLLILLVLTLICESKLRKLENAVAEFCTSRDGYNSGFCDDYAKLRRARETNNVTLIEEDVGNRTVLVERKEVGNKSQIVTSIPSGVVSSPQEILEKTASATKPQVKTETGDVILKEGSKTTVLNPKDTTGADEELGELTPDQIREELRKIIQEEMSKKTIQKLEDDPACNDLRDEYDEVCFATPPLAAFQETREFCLAFVKNCQNSLLTNIFTNVKNFKVDFSAYCKKHRERYRYVCPDPLRFQSFAEDAVEFCVRYKDRCPKEVLPAEPVMFHKKNEGHIYTREIEFWCTRTKRTAYNYCTEPDLLRVYKYAMFCGMYKMACIDVYRRVIYG